MFGGIIGLIIPIALVVVIVRAVQGRSDLSGGAPDVSLRRFFHYLVLLGLLIIVAMGSAGLLAEVLPEGDTIARRGSTDIALALAFTFVGAPLLVGMAFWTRRRLGADPNESESLGWAFYLTVTLLIALGVTMTIGAKVLHWALSDGAIDTTDVSHGAVWAIVWVVHWMISQRTISSLRMTAHTIAGSAAGLGVLIASVVLALGAALNTLYLGAVRDPAPRRLGGFAARGRVALHRWSPGLVVVLAGCGSKGRAHHAVECIRVARRRSRRPGHGVGRIRNTDRERAGVLPRL